MILLSIPWHLCNAVLWLRDDLPEGRPLLLDAAMTADLVDHFLLAGTRDQRVSLIAKAVVLFKGKLYEKWSFVFIFTLLFTFAATFGFGEQGIVFVPFIAMMAVSMGYDAILAVATVVFATAL
ncbi:MAG: hypothetical protein K0S80_174 [Neobacillus sp.]|nr:hypothetical protein [Neobacillus sp.]